MREGEPSATSMLVALARALVPAQGGRDPYAARLLPGRWARLADAGAHAPVRSAARVLSGGMVDHLALRTAAIDAFAREAVTAMEREAGEAQLVILGAGLDARAWRLGLGAKVFEVDHPATQTLKAARAPRERAPRFVPVDFTRDSLDDALSAAGHERARPTAWIWEGVTMYLPTAAVDATLGVIARRSARGSQLAMTYVDPSAVPLAPLVRRAFGLLFGEPLEAGFTPAALRALLAEHGLGVVRDGASDTWPRVLGGHPALAAVVRAERLVIAEKR